MRETIVSPNSSNRRTLYRLALVAWMAMALVFIVLFWIDVVWDYAELIVPCEGVPGVFNDCNFAALTPAEVSVWTTWGLSLQAYALIMLSGAAFTFLVYAALAGLLLWQQWQSWLGLTVSLALIVIPYTMFAGSRNYGDINPDLSWPAVIASLVGNGIMLLFLYLVPNGRFSPRWAFIPMMATFFLVSFGLQFQLVDRVAPTGPIVTVINAITVGLVLFGGGLQIYRYLRDSNALERQQTKWIIFGVVMFVSAIISWVLVFGRVLPVPDGGPRIIANLVGMAYSDYFALPFLPVAIVIAILRYRLWDIDFVVRRTTSYAIVTALLALVYFGSVVVLQRVFTSVTGQTSTLAIVLSTLLIAALFFPLRRRVQGTIDRRFFRQKYDAQQTLEAFAATVRDETDLDALTAELVRVIEETMQPEHVSVWLAPVEEIASGYSRPSNRPAEL